jgi:uncharacterized protein YegJ (DUF2314 family)
MLRIAVVMLVLAGCKERSSQDRMAEQLASDPKVRAMVEEGLAKAQREQGRQDPVVMFKGDDPELAAVKAKVQARLPELRASLQKGLPPGDALAVKAPFETDEGGIEWMWVHVTSWDGQAIHGEVGNEPDSIKRLSLGDKVEVQASDVADYIIRKADGTFEGGESAAILSRRVKEGK